MNLLPAKLGAEPRKLAYLAGLIVLAVVVYIWNRNPGESGPPTRPAGIATTPRAGGSSAGVRPASRSSVRVTQNGVGRNSGEYRPSLKPPKDIDPSAVDPTLRLGELAKLQDVKLEGGTRSLFEISATPPVEVKLKGPEPAKIKLRAFVGPMPPPPPPAPPPPPKAPRIPLKFYGFVNPARPDVKRAFFLENDEIIVAGEGDMIKKRYKILRIGINSAEVEDTVFKGDNTKQTLPLETESQG